MFSIYIYVNGLEYDIDCENPENCIKIKERMTENKKIDESDKPNDDINDSVN